MLEPNSPELKSFIPVSSDSDFPIQNLPYGVFTKKNLGGDKQIGVAIGDQVLNISELEREGLLRLKDMAFQAPDLNTFIELGESQWKLARKQISLLLREDNPKLRDHKDLQLRCLSPQSEVLMHLPVEIGDYTDFYSSKEHASNVGSMFRDKNNPLLPNWLHLPVGYHGRASSVVVGGTDIFRPKGQIMPPEAEKPILSACKRLDYELEMAYFIGKQNKLGQRVPVETAESHVFGLVLMNDWSARDIQKWEYQPLGPFTSKSFATSVSPWVVPLEALKPFAVKGVVQEPEPLEYLRHSENVCAHYDINLEVYLRNQGGLEQRLSSGNSKGLYWSMAQQIAHHTMTGCNLQVGDLMASGTVSGSEASERGCLLELTWGGQQPIEFGNEQRTFLEDGDTVVIKGWCQGKGYRIGFGDLSGTILPAQD